MESTTPKAKPHMVHSKSFHQIAAKTPLINPNVLINQHLSAQRKNLQHSRNKTNLDEVKAKIDSNLDRGFENSRIQQLQI